MPRARPLKKRGPEPRTMCGKGLHRMVAGNIYLKPNGAKQCRACQDARIKRHQEKKRAALEAAEAAGAPPVAASKKASGKDIVALARKVQKSALTSKDKRLAANVATKIIEEHRAAGGEKPEDLATSGL